MSVIHQAIQTWGGELTQQIPEERTSHAPPPKARILLAEDDFELRVLIAEGLSRCGFQVTQVGDGLQLYSSLFPAERCVYDLIIADVRMPGMSGIEALAGLRHRIGAPPIILITAFGDQSSYLAAVRLGALAFFDKPLEISALCDYVRAALSPDRGAAEPGPNGLGFSK
jgi:DNA-binding response OmpR family regulator